MDNLISNIKVAVVILNWNGQRYLEKFLPSLIKYTNREIAKIIIADNGSTDNSVTFLQKSYPNIDVILLDKNYGFTGGYNKALNHINAEYFVLLNSDIEVTKNWLEPIINFMDSDLDVAACQPKILSYKNKDYFEYAGAAGGFIDKYGYPFCRGRILSKLEKDTGQYDKRIQIFWASGACLFVRANLYKEFNGLDEDFFAHMEEVDLCWRIQNSGYKIYCEPASEVYHVGGGTLSNNSPQKLFLNYRNNLFLLIKNLPKKKLFFTILVRMILDGFSALIYLFSFKFSYFLVVLRAHIDFYKNISKLRKKRVKSEPSGCIKAYSLLLQKSILLQYFIKKTSKFSDLHHKTFS